MTLGDVLKGKVKHGDAIKKPDEANSQVRPVAGNFFSTYSRHSTKQTHHPYPALKATLFQEDAGRLVIDRLGTNSRGGNLWASS